MKLRVTDGKELVYKTWTAEAPKAVLLMIHGMAEHIKRYHEYAEFLSKNNITVYAYDQRGHGETAGSVEHLGYFGSGGWTRVVEDVHDMVNHIKENHTDLPLILMGHSMGSFIVRKFSSLYTHKIDSLILSGTAGSAGMKGRILENLAKLQVKFKGPEKPSNFVDTLTNKAFMQKIKPNRTNFDWLSRVEKEVDKYIDDPYCGTVFSNSFYAEMFHAVEDVNSVKCAERMDKKLPIYIFSGTMDPVGDYGKGVKKVHELYQIIGFEDVTMKLYEKARHEMLNEINKTEVYQDILNWINLKI